jgi:homocysteine S-methyltransferase
MAKYRSLLHSWSDRLLLTDGGIETTLIFQEQQALPCFASFVLLDTPEGEALLRKYYCSYVELAKRHHAGLVLDTATWRANAAWGEKLGYGSEALANLNRKSVQLLEGIRNEFETPDTPILISGCIGPQGDGYIPSQHISRKMAAQYHSTQIANFADTAVDLVTALTLNNVNEAVGIVLAAREVQLPVVISFTVETDGCLPSGQTLGSAIQEVDNVTETYASYYMINCAHPLHFSHIFKGKEPWLQRIHGVRANASQMSHAELNESLTLDSGDPAELAQDYVRLKLQLNSLHVFGGCCGTDTRHIEQMAQACAPLFG